MPVQENAFESLFPRTTKSPEETQQLGEDCAAHLQTGSILALVGSLGAGKTQFVKGLARGFGLNADEVSSPTFSIIHEYGPVGGGAGGPLTKSDPGGPLGSTLIHMDLYRLESELEVMGIGFEEYIDSDNVVVVEWPQVARNLFPAETISLSFSLSEGDERVVELLSKPADSDSDESGEGDT